MSEVSASFWEHVDELRSTLIRAAAIVLGGMVLAFICYGWLFSILTKPYAATAYEELIFKTERIRNPTAHPIAFSLPVGGELLSQSKGVAHTDNTYQIPAGAQIEYRVAQPSRLIVLGPLEGFVTAFKVSLWVGLLGTAPFWIMVLLKFILPGLRDLERRWLTPFLILMFTFLGLGALFAFFVTLPIASQTLMAFNNSLGENLWTLKLYVDFELLMLLANVAVFELAAMMLFLVHIGVLSASFLTTYRRHAIVIALVLGAILTPPDIVTQLLIAIPLLLFYEITILYAKSKRAFVKGEEEHDDD
jgi:sec-independent protein translocase protein TatC